jgi:hypothetical protein
MKYYRVQEKRNILHTTKRSEANWIGNILRRNCLPKHIIERNIEEGIEVTGRQGQRRKQLPDNLKEKRILEIEIGSIRSHFVENSLWKRLWTSRKTDYEMNE